MNMNTNSSTPAIITAENYTFSIPLYQRLFAWGEEQVNGLLHDLKNHFEKEGEVSYYLGMLSCIEKEGRYDLIDGQQRFTLMMLLGIKFQEYDNRWSNFLAGGNRLTFKARSKDTEYIKSLIHKSSFVAEKNEKMNCGLQAISNFMEKEFEAHIINPAVISADKFLFFLFISAPFPLINVFYQMNLKIN